MVIHRLDVNNTMLAVIDVQNDFCSPNGTMGKRGKDLTQIDPAVNNINNLMTVAEWNMVPTIVVRTEHSLEVDSYEWRYRFSDRLGKQEYPVAPNCVPGTWGAQYYNLTIPDSAHVVTKYRYSALSSKAFREYAYSTNARSIIFCGVTTDICVLSSAINAVDLDFLSSIISDASAAYSQSEQEESLGVFRRNFGSVYSSEEVLNHWENGTESLVQKHS